MLLERCSAFLAFLRSKEGHWWHKYAQAVRWMVLSEVLSVPYLLLPALSGASSISTT